MLKQLLSTACFRPPKFAERLCAALLDLTFSQQKTCLPVNIYPLHLTGLLWYQILLETCIPTEAAQARTEWEYAQVILPGLVQSQDHPFKFFLD